MGATAFVLGGGGVLGAAEVGMIQALIEAGIAPDLVVGTSVGAINGAVVAADPKDHVAERLTELWTSPAAREVFAALDAAPVRPAGEARPRPLPRPAAPAAGAAGRALNVSTI